MLLVLGVKDFIVSSLQAQAKPNSESELRHCQQLAFGGAARPPSRSYCQILCSEKVELSGVLQHSVHKNSPLEKKRQALMAMETLPFLLSGLGELEHHGQARFPCAVAFGSSVT